MVRSEAAVPACRIDRQPSMNGWAKRGILAGMTVLTDWGAWVRPSERYVLVQEV